MTNIARIAIERPLYTWLLILTCLVGGVVGIETVGRLEDPKFPIKTVLVVTRYDGASAVEVEQEVTDVIEAAIQELPYVDEMTSKSLDGRSEVMVQLLEQYGDEDTPQIFDELRRRVVEAAGRLPPGAGVPLVEDDFGDIYGVMYAVSVEGFSPAEIRDVSRYISTNLKSVPSVAKVQTAGEPFEAIYVEIDHTRLTRLGLPIESVFSSIAIQNQVTPAGSVAFDGRRLRIAPQMAFDSVQAVGDMRIGRPGSTEIIRLSDVATISREPVEIPFQLIRHAGKSSFTVGVSIVAERNVVHVGRDVEAKMMALSASLPLGMEVSEIYAQHKVVDLAIQQFLRNLALSVLTVVVALCIFMGWRAGTVVGMVLLLTVLGTLGIMAIIGVELQRISLGALMIAMGMLVDNGIVVAEGMIIGVRRGQLPVQAAESAVKRTQFPLLGATVIGIVAFGPISLSEDNSGHFLVSLFQVVAISLLLSWVLAVTVVPLFGKYLLKPEVAVEESALYSGWGYAPYRFLLGISVRYAWLAALVIFGILVACLWSFQFVKQGFFPTTNSPLFYVDYRLPEGSDIRQTEQDIIQAEEEVTQLPGVDRVTSFIGRGATRFTTIMNPEQPNSAYAQMVIRVQDIALMNDLMESVGALLGRIRPEAEIQVTRAEFTPSGTSKIEARFSGPDEEVLRELAGQALDIYLAHDLRDRKTDWRQPQLQLVPHFDTTRAQVAGITRRDLSQALAFATLGVNVGLFRDDDKVIPIIARAPASERRDLEGMMARMVWSPTQRAHIPITQIVDEIKVESVDSAIFRRDRVRTIQAQANPPFGHNPTRTFNRIRPEVEAIPLPLGYSMEWGGEHEASDEANTTLTQKIPFAFLLMFFITILMFGKLKQPIVIWLTVPMTVCGVVIGLVATNLSFTFPSFLGFLSLSGMLVKNCIVLLDEIDKRFVESEVSLTVLVQAAVSRLRPVVLAAGTTIAGMSPLLGDPFFLEMAVCIMSGLAFATLITLIAVPVFYRIALGKRVAQS